MSEDPVTPTVPAGRGGELLSMLAERIGARMAASTVYSSPIERDGVTIVPVAIARFGLGAGTGSDPSKGQEGGGGGGGGRVAPAGYIEIKDGRSRFVPIVHPTRMVALVAGAVIAGLAIQRPTQSQSSHGGTSATDDARAGSFRPQLRNSVVSLGV